MDQNFLWITLLVLSATSIRHDTDALQNDLLRRLKSGNLISLLYNPPPPETFMSTLELLRHRGYAVEAHKVKTQDGYILTIFRIPARKKSVKMLKPVILQHGLLSSSDDWLLIEDNLPVLLADKGYDVWLGNFRGNGYSQSNIFVTPKQFQFWDFSFHEFGVYDIPAMINYILSVTRRSNLYYIGHSLGTTAFFVAVAHNPLLNRLVKKMIALSPTAYGFHSKTLLKNLILVPPDLLKGLMEIISNGRFPSKFATSLSSKYSPHLCHGHLTVKLCLFFISLVVGFDLEQATMKTVSLMAARIPSPTSVKTIVHILQMARRPYFAHFDYGPQINFRMYNSVVPPLYRLANVRVPIKALYGLNDLLNTPEDAIRTITELGNVVEAGPVRFPKWNHIDFLFGKEAKTLVYDQCLQFLAKS